MVVMRVLLLLIWAVGVGAILPAGAADSSAETSTLLVRPPFWHTPLGVNRGNSELLEFLVGDRTRFDDPQALACAPGLWALADPGARPEFQVTVLGANRGAGVLLYNTSLAALDVLGDDQYHPGLFVRPHGVALAHDGRAWVTDPGAAKVIVLRWREGRFHPEGEWPPPPGGWREPWGVACDALGRVYVTDAQRDWICCYGPDGALLRRLGPDVSTGVRLEGPRAVAVTVPEQTWSYYHDRYLFVCDRGGTRILRLDPWAEGSQTIRTVSTHQFPPTDLEPRLAWMALDYYEQLWATDPENHCLHKLDRHLRHLGSFAGAPDDPLRAPRGVAVNRRFGQVFIADAEAAHYWWIGTGVRDVRARWRRPAVGEFEVRLRLLEPSEVRLRCLPGDAGGGREPVDRTYRLDAGYHRLRARVPPDWAGDSIRLKFDVRATYASARHFNTQSEIILAPLTAGPSP